MTAQLQENQATATTNAYALIPKKKRRVPLTPTSTVHAQQNQIDVDVKQWFDAQDNSNACNDYVFNENTQPMFSNTYIFIVTFVIMPLLFVLAINLWASV